MEKVLSHQTHVHKCSFCDIFSAMFFMFLCLLLVVSSLFKKVLEYITVWHPQLKKAVMCLMEC